MGRWLCSDGAEAPSSGEHDQMAGLPFSHSYMTRAPTISGSAPNSGHKATPKTDRVSDPREGERQ